MVPVLEEDETEDGQVMVDLASVAVTIDAEPKNGSFQPHWYKRPRAPTSPGVADVAPRFLSIITPAPLL